MPHQLGYKFVFEFYKFNITKQEHAIKIAGKVPIF